ncbi:adenosine receptor A3-like [Stylophora pistillata]|uniref:adenosine receptor A3-like n=1 Tax=Stylophora pistillata TaxID=50429 RepID=UPI000C04635B|nr:adenosine receptor A3-like [Stylophora pistillata]
MDVTDVSALKKTFPVSATFFVIYLLEGVLILLGNILAIFVFWKHREKLKRTSYLLVNLALADLFVVVGISLGLSSQVKIFITNELSTLEEFLTLFTWDVFCEGSSLLSLLVISLERLYAVRWPFRHRTLRTRSYIYSVAFVWITSGLMSAMFFAFLYHESNVVVFILAPVLFVFLVVLCVANILICVQMRRNVPEGVSEKRAGQNKKLTNTLLIVTILSLICWLPGTVMVFVVHAHGPEYAISTFDEYRVLKIFQLANSIVNPLVYTFRMPIFKSEIKECFSKRCRRNENRIENRNLEIVTQVCEEDVQGEGDMQHCETKL